MRSPYTALQGGDIRLADYAGKRILVVNAASHCGYTPQYASLQELWTPFRDQGLVIIRVPSNDFGGQEPGGADDIDDTAHRQYGVTFPLAAKVEVVNVRCLDDVDVGSLTLTPFDGRSL